MTIAITGATGHLGRLTIDALLDEQGIAPGDVVAVVRDATRATDLTESGVQVRTATYDDPEALRTALEGVDSLLLVSGLDFGSRVAQHTNVLEAAQAAGVTFLAYTSAPHADVSSLSIVPEHKATEEIIIASGLPYALLRNNWYTENYLGSLAAAGETGQLVSAAGEGRVASASRKDLASAAAAVVAQPERYRNRVLELSGSVAWTFADLAAALGEVLGRSVELVELSPEQLAEQLAAQGVDAGFAGYLVQMDRDIAAGTLGDATGDLAEVLGRQPMTLVESLRDPH